MWSRGCCRGACTSIFTMFTRIAAGRMIWATKLPIAARALQLLDAWEDELRLIYAPGGGPSHPGFDRAARNDSREGYSSRAFQRFAARVSPGSNVHRYATWDEVLDYCVYSANPVGRLVLYLCDYRDAERQRLSDCTCTALQLANFWQDVSRDLEKGRIYIPLEALAAHGLTESGYRQQRFDERYVALMKSLIARTRAMFASRHAAGANGRTVPAHGYRDVQPRRHGGSRCDRSVRLQHAQSIAPRCTKWTQSGLLGRALITMPFSRGSGTAPERTAKSMILALPHARDQSAADRSECRRRSIFRFRSCFVRGMQSHCARRAQQLLSGVLRAAQGQAQCALRAVCLHAAGGRRFRRPGRPGIPSAKASRAGARCSMKPSPAAPSGHAILPALADTIARFEIPTRYFHDLILGAEMDLTVTTYATFDRLSEYCYRVAGTVGLTCLHVFGFDDPKAPDLAERLGLAFQLTNIIRDVGSDYAMGRVYLPQEDLDRFAVRAEELRGPVTEKLKRLLEFEADRAWRMYREGAPLVAQVNAG